MRKFLVLALKEIIVTFRDRGAMVTMLVTPVVLTLAIAAAFGTGGDVGLSDIPTLVLNHDPSPFAEEIAEIFTSDRLADLLAVEVVTDEAAARARVEANQVAALVIIPADFSHRALPLAALVEEQMGLDLLTMTEADSAALSPEQQQMIGQLFMQAQEIDTDPAIVEVYASTDWPISSSVVLGVTTQILEQMNMTLAGTSAIISRMAEALIAQGQEAQGAMGGDLGGGMGESGLRDLPVKLAIVSPSGRGFNWLDYSAASMAVLFLMFAVTSGGRTLLAERQMGTLPRLLIMPTHSLTILLGKMAGIVLAGLLQVGVLWGATSLIGAYWGEPVGVIAALLGLVLAATGVGALISAWAKTTTQAGAIGTAVTLVAAAVSGTFFPRMNLPAWVRTVSLATPNAWGIEMFARLQSGRTLVDILPWLGGLLLLTVIYYAIAAVGFRRQFN